MKAETDKAVSAWLRRLKWALAHMPSPEREDILDEAATHIEDALANGQSAADILEEFGSADSYARQFFDSMEMTAALGSGHTTRLFAAVARRIHRSLIALGGLLIALVVAAVGISAVVAAIWKVIDPVHVGFWLGPNFAFLGTITDPSMGRDILGIWLWPLSLLVSTLSWLLCRFVLSRTLRALSR